METEFPNADGSITSRTNGYRLDFVAQLPHQLAYLRDSLGVDAVVLDLSIASLQYLDACLTERKCAAQPLPQALAESLVAYCGEVLRHQVGGQWFYYLLPADEYGGERYIPAIQSAAGTEIEFVGLVSKEFRRASGCYLFAFLSARLAPPLPVESMTTHPAGSNFPPLPKRPPIQKIFPSQE